MSKRSSFIFLNYFLLGLIILLGIFWFIYLSNNSLPKSLTRQKTYLPLGTSSLDNQADIQGNKSNSPQNAAVVPVKDLNNLSPSN